MISLRNNHSIFWKMLLQHILCEFFIFIFQLKQEFQTFFIKQSNKCKAFPFLLHWKYNRRYYSVRTDYFHSMYSRAIYFLWLCSTPFWIKIFSCGSNKKICIDLTKSSKQKGIALHFVLLYFTIFHPDIFSLHFNNVLILLLHINYIQIELCKYFHIFRVIYNI